MAKKMEKGNFQDDAMVKEYDKGQKSVNSRAKKYRRRSQSSNPKDKIIAGEKGGNDISWHNPDDSMFNDVTGITINAAVGRPLLNYTPAVGTYSLGSLGPQNWGGYPVYNPGIMVATFIPTFGNSPDGNSPFNKAMVKLFQFIRKNKSGTEIYQPADVGMVVGALDSAFMFYTLCVKLYGLVNEVNIMNDYTPRTFVRAHGCNYEDLRSNRANFKFWIDQFANDLRGFYVPKGIHIFDRHCYMTEQLFTDGDTNKAQVYSFLPASFWQFTEGTQASPHSSLVLSSLISTNLMNAVRLEFPP